MSESDKNKLIVPVILCGGQGSRLWPASRPDRPKPFLKLLDQRSLFQQTLDRCTRSGVFEPPIIVCGPEHVELARQNGSHADGTRFIVEPAARNTAPAIGLAASRLKPDTIMLVCPSDHRIADTDKFVSAVQDAAKLAAEGWLVSLAIAADRPETGYGYIKRGETLTSDGYRVDRFVEKPDSACAVEFVNEGSYFWNGGIFVFRAGALLSELARFRPAMATAVELAVMKGTVTDDQFHPEAEAFAKIQSESIDYAVMEQTSTAAMVPATMGWSDIGNWASLKDAMPKDDNENSAIGDAELVDCKNVLAVSDGPRISAIGLEDVCIIVDGDNVLVTTRDAAPNVGKLSGERRE